MARGSRPPSLSGARSNPGKTTALERRRPVRHPSRTNIQGARDNLCIRPGAVRVCPGMNLTTRTSAVEFPTPTRLHVAVAVRDVAAALPFYRTLFGQEPTRVRGDYAKFEVLDPPVNFSLNAPRPVRATARGPSTSGSRSRAPTRLVSGSLV